MVQLLDERKSLEKEKQAEQETMDALKRQSLYLTGEIRYKEKVTTPI